MTAEIAILNKSAVALAADSAVTISAGGDQTKVFDSADKLFELSCHDAIGIMVNGDMNFMQAPIGVLIKKYRSSCPKFERVSDAGDHFLRYLADFGASAPDSIKQAAVSSAVRRVLQTVSDRVTQSLVKKITSAEQDDEGDFQDRIANLRRTTISEQLTVMKAALSRLPDAEFSGEGKYDPTASDIVAVDAMIESVFPGLGDKEAAEAREVGLIALHKRGSGASTTGMIVAGFGDNDLFPTLVSFEISGIVGDRLKFSRGEVVDIDREGTRARVVPFAQREMVERFLYGLDEGIRRNIINFCKKSVPDISSAIFDTLEIDADDLAALREKAEQAEQAFFDGLTEDSFEALRVQSQAEIEDMVEFMPKPELARMAEALVNLTSIKRRVTRGMETVGGPIDVAVISQAEGFVWVKRKHYFPGELNSRYFDRKRAELDR